MINTNKEQKHAKTGRSRSTARAADNPASCRVPWRVSGPCLQTHQQRSARDPTWTLCTRSDDVITTVVARPGGGHSSLIAHSGLSGEWLGHIHDPLVPLLDKRPFFCTIRNV